MSDKYFITLLIFILSFSVNANLYLVPTPPSTPQRVAHTIIDANSHKVFATQNAHKKHDIASLTKLMTAYVAFKRIQSGFAGLDNQVEISDKAYKTSGSRSFIERGEQVSLEVLLKGMIIQSGNDASVAVAEHIAGDEETFVKLMNHYANEMAMKNTVYKNASGLPQEGHYSSAYDTALISIALITEFPQYYKWFGEKEFTHNNITQKNRNAMLWTDSSVDGLKTGYTEAAGYCLVISSKHDDMRLVSVVLGAKSKRERRTITKKLLDYSFRFYETQPLMDKSEVIANVRVKTGKKSTVKVGSLKKVYITLARGQFKTVKQFVKLPKNVVAPVQAKQMLGQLLIKVDDEIIANYPLYTLEAVKKSTGFSALIDKIKNFF